MIYVDSSALLKRYVEEPDSDLADELLSSDPDRAVARHTIVEVRRNLARLLEDRAAGRARAAFERDVGAFAIVELDSVTCEAAASIAETVAVRTLDALHLAAARRLGPGTPFVTFDVRQAQAARALGFNVLGA